MYWFSLWLASLANMWKGEEAMADLPTIREQIDRFDPKAERQWRVEALLYHWEHGNLIPKDELKKKKVNRSAVTGRFVSRKQAEDNPETTIEDTV